jgi:2'-5' RNA ligase
VLRRRDVSMNMTTAKETTRLFYALWPDDATRTALMQLQINFGGRLTRYENLHITLAFLGEQPTALLPALKDLLDHLPKSEMTVTLDRLGYFPRNHITLARDASPPPDIVFNPIIWQVNQAVLVQSKTQPDGISYRVLASRSLDEEVWTPNALGER